MLEWLWLLGGGLPLAPSKKCKSLFSGQMSVDGRIEPDESRNGEGSCFKNTSKQGASCLVIGTESQCQQYWGRAGCWARITPAGGQPGMQGWVQACGKCRARLLKHIKLRASHLHLRGTKGTGGTSGRTEEQEREKKSEQGRKEAGKWAEKKSALQQHWGEVGRRDARHGVAPRLLVRA